MPNRTPADDEIIEWGLRNIIVAPLLYQDRVIGTLELGSPKLGDLDATHLPKLHQILPLFSMAVQRSMEELNSRIQAFIKEKCTAIHPVVEWRFRKAVLKSIDQRAEDANDTGAELEPIVFDRVYPLYALSDIRGSSTQRSLAIQADLLTQLRLARDVIRWAHDARPLPGLHELLYRLDKHAAKIQTHLNSGDEVSIIAFLRADVEAKFDHLQTFGPGVRERIEAYRASLDPRIGTVYDRRRLFEESVTRIADGISVLPRPRGPDRPDDVPALLREAEDGRGRPPDLRRRLAARGRALRPALPEEPPSLAADGHVRRRAAGQ